MAKFHMECPEVNGFVAALEANEADMTDEEIEAVIADFSKHHAGCPCEKTK